MYRYIRRSIFILAAVVLSGCATIPILAGRYHNAEEIARTAGFERSYIKSGNFTLTIYTRIDKPQDPVTIYIEGDGLAYLNRSRVSMDPTPANPIALKLAALDPAPNVAYIARPGQLCQGETPNCGESYWTTRRFSEEVIRSVDETVSEIKRKVGSEELSMVGFSGGAAIACLVAARRNDVGSIRTVAGNLDPDAVNVFHKVSKLKGALNPMGVAVRLIGIPQRHFIGGHDKIIPPSITSDFAKKSGDFIKKTITVVPEAEHNKGWAERWVGLLELSPVKPSEYKDF